jgi:hypothetical protein
MFVANKFDSPRQETAGRLPLPGDLVAGAGHP